MSRSRPCPSTLQPTPLPGPDNAPQSERPSKANDRTVSWERHKSHSQRKGRKKKGVRQDLQLGVIATAPWNTCSCTALLITVETAGSRSSHIMLVAVGTWSKDYWFGTVFYSVNCFNLSLLLIQETFYTFTRLLSTILLLIYSAHLREMLVDWSSCIVLYRSVTVAKWPHKTIKRG